MSEPLFQNESIGPLTDLIFDLGHVFVFYHPHPDAPIPPRAFKEILQSPDYYAYESGLISKTDYFSKITTQNSLSPDALRRTVEMCISTFHYNHALVHYVRELKAATNVRVHAMSNISHAEFAALEGEVNDWAIFDTVTTSAQAGVRKPDLNFYGQVLDKVGVAADKTLFVDDKKINVAAAEAVGMNGLWFENEVDGLKALKHVLGSIAQPRDETGERTLKSERHPSLSNLRVDGLESTTVA